MEPASFDPKAKVICLPLDLEWKDIGSWTVYGSLTPTDDSGNTTIQTITKEHKEITENKSLIFESNDTLVVSSDPEHLIACFGCVGLTVVHIKDATFIGLREWVEEIKRLHSEVGNRFNGKHL